jgi:hypothetical protein
MGNISAVETTTGLPYWYIRGSAPGAGTRAIDGRMLAPELKKSLSHEVAKSRSR